MLWDPLGSLALGAAFDMGYFSLFESWCFRGPTFIGNLRLHDRESRWSLPDFAQVVLAQELFRKLSDLCRARGFGRRIDRRSRPIARSDVHQRPPSELGVARPCRWLGLILKRRSLYGTWRRFPMLALSIWLVGRGLESRPVWSVFPVTVLLLLCDPLYQQIYQGQLNLVLLALLCGTWAAERSGRPRLARTSRRSDGDQDLPAFLFAYYALRRRWVVVASGFVSLGLFTGLTAAVFGLDVSISTSA